MDAIDNKVLVVRIEKVEKHPNADRLDLAHVHGWQCVVQKGVFKAGDLAIYLPIDSILPPDLERRLFPEESKVKLSKSRIRTIKLRGAISQGMLLSIFDASGLEGHGVSGLLEEGADVTTMLGVTHYEPPAAPPSMRGDPTAKKKRNPFFPEYTKLSHFKNYPDLFDEDERVVVTEKIHGTNFRAGWAPVFADTWWKRIKKTFGFLPKYEFVVGSHRVQINTTKNWKGFYPTNVYATVAKQYDLAAKIPDGFIVYGEIYGDGIQKGYSYGHSDGTHSLAIFDVWDTEFNRYVSWAAVELLSRETGVPTVPVVYRGPYKKELVKEWESGPSIVHPAQAHREGVVVKPSCEAECWIGRKMLRSINPEYLLRSESDFH